LLASRAGEGDPRGDADQRGPGEGDRRGPDE
jgi:ribosome biogenesis GTPase